jgi:hypothetical protein
MRLVLIGVAAIATMAVIGPALAQVVPYRSPQPLPPAAYATPGYAFPGLSPDDAYRQGLINRWQLEQYTGPTPQALQGPSPDGRSGLGAP